LPGRALWSAPPSFFCPGTEKCRADLLRGRDVLRHLFLVEIPLRHQIEDLLACLVVVEGGVVPDRLDRDVLDALLAGEGLEGLGPSREVKLEHRFAIVTAAEVDHGHLTRQNVPDLQSALSPFRDRFFPPFVAHIDLRSFASREAKLLR
jgi:hypothetical protein